MAIGAAAVLSLALAACNDDPDPDPDPTPGGPATETPGAAGQVASCVVGDWRSSEVEHEVAGVDVTGGAGIGLSVAEDGATSLDFAGMEPVSFTGEVAGAQLAGELVYAGQATATVRTDTGADSGAWEPTESDWNEVTVTVDVTEPVEVRPFDDTPLGDAIETTDEWTGDVVDFDPILNDGTFTCEGDTTLLIDSADDTGMSWTFTRS